MDQTEVCVGCRARVPVGDGPTHRYIESAPACWEVYTELLAGEPVVAPGRSSPLLVDAYAAQHPGGGSPQATQSVAVHTVVLLTAMEGRGGDLMGLRKQVVELGRLLGGFPRLQPPSSWSLTIHDVVRGPDAETRRALADEWCGSVLSSWMEVHGGVIAGWASAVAERHG